MGLLNGGVFTMAMTNDDPIRRNFAVNVVWYGVIHHLNVVTINVTCER